MTIDTKSVVDIKSTGSIHIPTEPIGSLPRPDELIQAEEEYRQGKIDLNHLNLLRIKAVQDTIKNFEDTESPIITDGEQTKSSFINYPIETLANEYYNYSGDCFALLFNDGHQRLLPRLIKAPFRYGTFAHTYIDQAKMFTKLPIKQAVIAPSALSMVYPKATIDGYSREQFLADLINEAEKDIRKCFESGAHSVQLDFTEARYSLKIDSTGQLLQDFININNQVLDRFELNLRNRLGIHICPARIRDLKKAEHRIFIGVIDPIKSEIETPEEVCNRILEAVEYISIDQLGTTDDCGFSPFNDDQSTSRQIAFEKIRARIQGTKLAEQKLMIKKI